jgi:hypothetical protein
MLAMWVKVRVKPGERERFLKAIEVDALGSERDEPGCLRFNVLQDRQDQNIYYFFDAAYSPERYGNDSTGQSLRASGLTRQRAESDAEGVVLLPAITT